MEPLPRRREDFKALGFDFAILVAAVALLLAARAYDLRSSLLPYIVLGAVLLILVPLLVAEAWRLFGKPSKEPASHAAMIESTEPANVGDEDSNDNPIGDGQEGRAIVPAVLVLTGMPVFLFVLDWRGIIPATLVFLGLIYVLLRVAWKSAMIAIITACAGMYGLNELLRLPLFG